MTINVPICLFVVLMMNAVIAFWMAAGWHPSVLAISVILAVNSIMHVISNGAVRQAARRIFQLRTTAMPPDTEP